MFANRSLTCQKTDRFDKALSDAEQCIKLKPDYGKVYAAFNPWAMLEFILHLCILKGYYLKGQSLHGQRRFDSAMSTFCDGLVRDPDYMMIVRLIESAEQLSVNGSGISSSKVRVY